MKDTISKSASKIISDADHTVEALEKKFNAFIEPTRKTVFQRFPIVFTLLSTFGVVTTFLGFELLLAEFTFLYERPWLLLCFGVAILIATGSLYKKLG